MFELKRSFDFQKLLVVEILLGGEQVRFQKNALVVKQMKKLVALLQVESPLWTVVLMLLVGLLVVLGGKMWLV